VQCVVVCRGHGCPPPPRSPTPVHFPVSTQYSIVNVNLSGLALLLRHAKTPVSLSTKHIDTVKSVKLHESADTAKLRCVAGHSCQQAGALKTDRQTPWHIRQIDRPPGHLVVHHWNKDPMPGQIGTKCPILHAKKDQLYPIGFSDPRLPDAKATQQRMDRVQSQTHPHVCCAVGAAHR
jgi:hypothetical protein